MITFGFPLTVAARKSVPRLAAAFRISADTGLFGPRGVQDGAYEVPPLEAGHVVREHVGFDVAERGLRLGPNPVSESLQDALLEAGARVQSGADTVEQSMSTSGVAFLGIGYHDIDEADRAAVPRDVPVRMAGAAGGALQTGQRLGGAVGTAALPGTYYLVLTSSGGDYRLAVAVSVGVGIAAILTALGIALIEWRTDRGVTANPCPPEVAHGHCHAAQS